MWLKNSLLSLKTQKIFLFCIEITILLMKLLWKKFKSIRGMYIIDLCIFSLVLLLCLRGQRNVGSCSFLFCFYPWPWMAWFSCPLSMVVLVVVSHGCSTCANLRNIETKRLNKDFTEKKYRFGQVSKTHEVMIGLHFSNCWPADQLRITQLQALPDLSLFQKVIWNWKHQIFYSIYHFGLRWRAQSKYPVLH